MILVTAILTVKVIFQRHGKFTWKESNTDAKTRFYTGITSVALFNTIFTLIKTYKPHITYWKGQKQILKRTGRKKVPASLNPHGEFLLTLIRLRLWLLNEDVADGFDISPTKFSFIFTTWI